MDQTGALRKRIEEMSGLAANTASVERRILESAEERAAAVTADMDKLRPRVQSDPAAGGQYEQLVAEYGRLQIVMANARRALG